MQTENTINSPQTKQYIEQQIQELNDIVANNSISSISSKIHDRIRLGTISFYAFYVWFKKHKKVFDNLNKDLKDELKTAEKNLGDVVGKSGINSDNPIDWYHVKIYKGVTNTYVNLDEITDNEYRQLLILKKEIDERIQAKEAYFKELASTIFKSKSNNPFEISSDKSVTIDTEVPYLMNRKETVTVKIPQFKEIIGLKLDHNG